MAPKKAIVSPLHVAKFNEIFKGFMANENIEIKPASWVLPNRVKFSQEIAKQFNYDIKKVPANEKLFESQRFVKDYLQYNSPYRGVLLYHALGTGKSQASIVAAENLINEMDVVILLPASLKPNYVEEIKKVSTFFTVQQNWVFKDFKKFKDEKEVVDMICQRMFVDEKLIKRQKGIWIPQKTGDQNWKSMTAQQKKQINEQVNTMIETKYRFINYNGISPKKIAEMAEDGNPFDNKVIIVDEVHNLISGTVGSGQRGIKLYNLLLTAKNAKIVLLSGTPIINHPYEIAFIVNLLKGPVYYYELTAKQFDPSKITNILEANPYVDDYQIHKDKNMITIQLLPSTFVFKDKKKFLVVKDSQPKSIEQITKTIVNDVKAKDIQCTLSRKSTLIFPITNVSLRENASQKDVLKEAFDHYFLDFVSEDVKNTIMLARRMLGCISYFGVNSKEYPKRLPDINVVLDMSKIQFGVYRENRGIERAKEERAKKNEQKKNKKKAGDENLFKSTGQIYRAYSRANCNFVFPDKIVRPYPAKVGMLFKETEGEDDVDKDDDDKQDNEVKKEKLTKKDEETYKEKIDKALAMLSDPEQRYLHEDNLRYYSPKFHSIIKTLNDSGDIKALVYSQFRTVEGLGVLSLALDQNGWSEFKVKREGTDWVLDMSEGDLKKPTYFQYRGDQEETKLLMNIFNNDMTLVPDKIKEILEKNNMLDNKHGNVIKLIMITQSGAEGISLKHVRQVHILEPYWNEIRIEQVVGRAIRAKSHLELPEAERNVQVYRYIVKMTTEQVKEDVSIENLDTIMILNDKGNKVKVPATTDEYILDIAFRKAKIINKVQEIMKEASVNCMVHKKAHPGIRCFAFPQNADPNALAYQLDYEKEESDLEYKQKVRKEVISGICKRCKIGNTAYAYNPKNRKLYDLAAYEDGRLQQVGYLEMVGKSDGKQKARLVLLDE